MIKIIISTNPTVRLFDRMPLPQNGKNSLAIKALRFFRKNTSLRKYMTNPFVRKITKIA